MARPTEFSQEVAARICDEVANGSNLNRICAREDFPSRTTVYVWFQQHPSFADNYARSRETRGDGRFDKIDDVVDDMRAGTIDSNTARVQIDAIKWQAGKEKPKAYGDKIQQEVTGKDGAPFTVVVSSVLDRDK